MRASSSARMRKTGRGIMYGRCRREIEPKYSVCKSRGELKAFLRATLIRNERENKSVWAVYHLRADSTIIFTVRNRDRVTRELSRINEPTKVFLQSPRWLEPLNENILQVG